MHLSYFFGIGLSIISVVGVGCDAPGGSGGVPSGAGLVSIPNPPPPNAQTLLKNVSSSQLKEFESTIVQQALAEYPKSAACMLLGLEANSSVSCEWDYDDCMTNPVTKSVTFDTSSAQSKCGERSYGELEACADGFLDEARELWDFLSSNSCQSLWGTPVQVGVPDACLVFEGCW